MTTRERLESEKVLAQLGLWNAAYHRREVRERFGKPSPELAVAEAVEETQRLRFVKACDALVDFYTVTVQA